MSWSKFLAKAHQEPSQPPSAVGSASSAAPALHAPGGQPPAPGVPPADPTSRQLIEQAMQLPPDDLGSPDLPVTQPRGLVNRGNYCFMNVVLQSLIGAPRFGAALHKLSGSALLMDRSPSLRAWAELLRDTQTSAHPPVASGPAARTARGATARPPTGNVGPMSPVMFYPLLAHFRSVRAAARPGYLYHPAIAAAELQRLVAGPQEDAHEFLEFALGQMHDDLAALVQAWGSATHSSRQGRPSPGRRVGRGGQGGQEAALRCLLFGGTLRSNLRREGARGRTTVEPFHSLSLDIADPQVQRLEDALWGLIRREHLAEVHASKQMSLDRLPPLLVIHLKRFVYGPHGPLKLAKPVSYGPYLEIPAGMLLRPTPKPCWYRLMAVITHLGQHMGNGHYTCDVLRRDGDGWFHYDDDSVTPVSTQAVFSRPAYILLFQSPRNAGSKTESGNRGVAGAGRRSLASDLSSEIGRFGDVTADSMMSLEVFVGGEEERGFHQHDPTTKSEEGEEDDEGKQHPRAGILDLVIGFHSAGQYARELDAEREEHMSESEKKAFPPLPPPPPPKSLHLRGMSDPSELVKILPLPPLPRAPDDSPSPSPDTQQPAREKPVSSRIAALQHQIEASIAKTLISKSPEKRELPNLVVAHEHFDRLQALTPSSASAIGPARATPAASVVFTCASNSKLSTSTAATALELIAFSDCADPGCPAPDQTRPSNSPSFAPERWATRPITHCSPISVGPGSADATESGNHHQSMPPDPTHDPAIPQSDRSPPKPRPPLSAGSVTPAAISDTLFWGQQMERPALAPAASAKKHRHRRTSSQPLPSSFVMGGGVRSLVSAFEGAVTGMARNPQQLELSSAMVFPLPPVPVASPDPDGAADAEDDSDERASIDTTVFERQRPPSPHPAPDPSGPCPPLATSGCEDLAPSPPPPASVPEVTLARVESPPSLATTTDRDEEYPRPLPSPAFSQLSLSLSVTTCGSPTHPVDEVDDDAEVALPDQLILAEEDAPPHRHADGDEDTSFTDYEEALSSVYLPRLARKGPRTASQGPAPPSPLPVGGEPPPSTGDAAAQQHLNLVSLLGALLDSAAGGVGGPAPAQGPEAAAQDAVLHTALDQLTGALKEALVQRRLRHPAESAPVHSPSRLRLRFEGP
ncbi:putative cysteine proteinase [Paratrimastix pyriformis]|uniref:ubiquitinyl hydrolase 1 n=1 Tax=Paratrimastix pyriformis TaxID=342808 RepID=A0ABQ8UNN6_9EUKA|nr:putative cysteine proteinase [Paratrimastix pyriformis]